MNRNSVSKQLVTGLITIGLSKTLFSATIYDNSVNDLLTRFNPGTAEVGDQIVLAGTERYLTQFDFEYYGTNTANPLAFSGSVQANVKIYLNDGPLFNGYATPGTVLFNSGLFNVSPTARQTVILSIGTGDLPPTGLFLPSSDLTWSVQFSGMGATDDVGLDLYSPPDVGSSFPDYWQNSGGSWQLLTNNAGIPIDFGARFFATANPVPEPNLAGLGALGVALSLGITRWKIRSRK